MTRKQPNILYIFADQWRRQAAGFMEEDPVYTPNIDRFSKEGLVFTQAVSCTPLCSPHRASLMTGKYALSTGVFTNCKTGLDMMLSPDEIGIGDVLKREGYRTGYIGKWHLDEPERNKSEQPASGADDWDAYTPPGPKRHGFDYWYSYGASDEHMTPHYWTDSHRKIEVREWSVEHETDKALAFIEENGGGATPFSLFLSWNPPHSPFHLVPERYKKLYADTAPERRGNVVIREPFLVHTGETIPGGERRWEEYANHYFAAVSGIDEQFGRLLERLEQLDIAENTIVVLTSDHGELLGSHGLMAKHTWHEESIGVPFIIRWPKRIATGTTTEVLNTVDIMPTLLELLDIPIPRTVEGLSLATGMLGHGGPGAAGDDGSESQDRPALISAYPGRLDAIAAFREAGLNHLAYGWRGLRTKRYTYVVDRGYMPAAGPARWLYDLQADPLQLHPIEVKHAAEHPVAAKLEIELKERLAGIHDPFELYIRSDAEHEQQQNDDRWSVT